MINKVASSEIFDLYAKRMISKRAISIAGGAEVSHEIARAAQKIAPVIEGLEAAATPAAGALRTISEAKPAEAISVFKKLKEVSGIEASTEKILDMAIECGYSGSYKDVMSEFSKDFVKMADEMGALNPASDLNEFYSQNRRALDFFEKLKGRGGQALLSTEAISAARAAEEAKAVAKSKESARAYGETIKNVGETVSKVTSGITGLAITAGLGYLAYSVHENGIASTLAGLFGFSKSKDSIDNLDDVAAAIDCINKIGILAGTESAMARREVLKNLDKFLYYQKLQAAGKASEESLNAIKEADAAAEILVAGSDKSGSISNFILLLSQNPQHLSGVSTTMAASAGGIAGGIAGLVVGMRFGKLGGALGAALGAAIGALPGGVLLSNWYSDQLNCLTNAADAIKSFYDRLGQENKAAVDEGTNADSSGSGGIGTTDDLNVLANILSAMSRENLNRDGFPGIELVNESNIISGMIRGEGSAQTLAKFILDRDNYNIKTYLSNISQSDKGSKIDFRFANKYSDLISQVYAQLQLMNRERKMNKSSKSTNNQQLIRNAAETKVSYFEDAKLGLKDQLTKSYYTGLTGMYNEKPQKRTSDYKDLYGTQKETGEDLIVQSHPKSITLAESMGKGGLVENNLEQQQKSIYVATTTPSGNFQSKYAQTINYLEKLSKAADNQGKKEVSRIINQTIKHLK